MLDAQLGFETGVVRLIARLSQLGIVQEKNGALPTRKSYNDACAKLPVPIILELFRKSHEDEYKALKSKWIFAFEPSEDVGLSTSHGDRSQEFAIPRHPSSLSKKGP